jgi:hypothetical protein
MKKSNRFPFIDLPLAAEASVIPRCIESINPFSTAQVQLR